METLLREMCLQEKDTKNLSFQNIADQADLSVSTVKTSLDKKSKNPSIAVYGPICAVLGISLDDYFGIPRPDSSSEEVNHLRLELELQKDHIRRLDVALAKRDLMIGLLSGLICFGILSVIIMFVTITGG